MRRIAKLAKWGIPIVVLHLIAEVLFIGQPAIIMAGTSKTSPAYWSNCVKLAHQQVTHPQTPEPMTLDDCYQSLLAKFGVQFLNDVTDIPVNLFSDLQAMKKVNQQPSVGKVLVQEKYSGDIYGWERQELTFVGQTKVDPQVVKGYNAAIDKPLFDQFVKQQLPIASNQKMDQWFTRAVLAAQASNRTSNIWPRYNPDPSIAHASPPGDITYHGGNVIDGTVNVYLIFWIDASFQPASPKYVSLIEQFVKDLDRSPLYANLMQYTDSLGRSPTGVRLAGTIMDTRPFPQELLDARSSPTYSPTDTSKLGVSTSIWQQEIQNVAAKQGWKAQDRSRDYHNLFILLPTLNWQCGSHLYMQDKTTGRAASPYAFVSYPYYKNQQGCPGISVSPNNDHATDLVIDSLSHELIESVTDPFLDGWRGSKSATSEMSGANEMGDICLNLPKSVDAKFYQIDLRTHGNVTWHGHTYAIQPEYDNYRHGCMWEGP